MKQRLTGVFFLTVVGYALSFVAQLVISYFWGTSPDLDAYWAGLAVINFFCFYLNPLREAVVPAIYRARQESEEKGALVLTAGTTLLLILLSISSAVFWVALDLLPIAGLAGRAVSVSQMALLAPWLIAFMWLFALSETLNTVLVGLGRVVFQAKIRIVGAMAFLLMVIAYGWTRDIAIVWVAQVVGLSLAVALGALGLRQWVGWQWPGGLGALLKSDFSPLFISLLGSYFLSQLYLVAEKGAMVHLEPGLVSSFQYSTSLVNVLITLTAFPLANVLWEKFLAFGSKDSKREAAVLAVKACGVLFLVYMVICSFVWTHAKEVIQTVYGRGAFGRDSVRLTAVALEAGIFSAVPIGIMAVLGRFLMSFSNAYRQVWIGLCTTVAGMLVVSASVMLDSPRLILWHWLIANSAGLLVSVAIFLAGARFTRSHYLASVRWVLLTAMVVGVSAILTPNVDWGHSVMQSILGLAVEFVVFCALVCAGVFAFRLYRPLKFFEGERG